MEATEWRSIRLWRSLKYKLIYPGDFVNGADLFQALDLERGHGRIPGVTAVLLEVHNQVEQKLEARIKVDRIYKPY